MVQTGGETAGDCHLGRYSAHSASTLGTVTLRSTDGTISSYLCVFLLLILLVINLKFHNPLTLV